MKPIGVLMFLALLTSSAYAQEGPSSYAADVDPIEKQIRGALAEGRLVDAGRLLDITAVKGLQDPRLDVLGGELALARNRPTDAIADVATAESIPAFRAGALQVKGLALAQLGRPKEAIPVLSEAVALDPTLWRAWNGLGAQFDTEKQFDQAEEAYGRAAKESNDAPAVLNNRGYSRLVQGRTDEAVIDFVKALEKAPGSAVARTNLRIALAARGDYARATAPGIGDDKATLLNNAGFGAVLGGDYAEALILFDKAQSQRGVNYDRASFNRRLADELLARSNSGKAANNQDHGHDQH